ncbi:hypothetical protein [Citromicrobium bathyomarinum]|uniref:hypothetical protein n=1 Tax=Citromicrobium bathyomarinum TaxID=72174 RepID=UPI001E2D6E02|nr:hypothetical protein [Citromicrobium bathyomarinum]
MDRTSCFTRALRAVPALGPSLALALAATPLMAQAGPIDTLPLGKYECTLPGDAGGAAWHRIPGRDFTILNASSYEASGERGVYLLRGTHLTFTRGPLKGMMLERSGQRILRERDEKGELGPMRCVLTSPPR